MTTVSPDEQDRLDMARLVAGHDSALNSLMERHKVRLYQYLVRSLQNDDDAEDLAQETFVRVYQNKAKYDPRQKFSTWLYAIASNAVRTRFRWRRRHPEVSIHAENEDHDSSLSNVLPDQRPLPSEFLEKHEQVAAVRRALASIPEKLRTPLILVEYEDLSYAEAAEVLNCTARAIDSRVARARQLLREKLLKVATRGNC